jgi:hypothetical protein
MVTSSLNETSTEIGALFRRHNPFVQQADGQIFKDDVNGFPSISDICFLTGLEHYIKGLLQRLYGSLM